MITRVSTVHNSDALHASESGHLAGVAMIDMSAAFDVAVTSLLLKKCSDTQL